MSEHLALPLRVTRGGRLATLATGSAAEIGQSVQVLLATRVGERVSEPRYGSRDLLGVPTGEVRVDTAAIQAWERRATADLVAVTVTGFAS